MANRTLSHALVSAERLRRPDEKERGMTKRKLLEWGGVAAG